MDELKIKIFELTQCAGCQSCLREDENDVIQQLDHFVASKDVTDEIQTLRAKVEVLVEALETIATESHPELWQVEVATKALATYDKLSEVGHETI